MLKIINAERVCVLHVGLGKESRHIKILYSLLIKATGFLYTIFELNFEKYS